MEIHTPKESIRTWRAFLEEVGIIVLGVLIALGAEQVAEAMHWVKEVRDAHAAFGTEMVQANRSFAFRIAAEPCVARRLDTLGQITERAASHQGVPHVGFVQPDIANAFNDGAWQAYRASQAVAHFRHSDLERYDAYYGQLEHVRDWIAEEHDAWDTLERLQGDPTRLGPEDFAILRGAIAHARTSNRYIALISREELQTSDSVGMGHPVADARRLRDVCG